MAYRTVGGVMDEVAQETDPNIQRERTYYDPYASENPNNTVGAMGSFGEWLGTASPYRSQGYAVDRNKGLVGGSQEASQAQQTGYGISAGRQYDNSGRYENAYWDALGNSNQGREAQMAGLGMTRDTFNTYRNMANGQGPSLANLQLQQGLQQAQAQQASMAAGARGGGANLAAAQLAGATMAGQQAAGANQQAAMLRQQEQLAAMQGMGALSGQYGGLAGQMRGQDFNAAGLGMQGYQFGQNQGLAYEKMRQQQQLAELGAQTDLEKTQGELALQKQKQNAQENQESAKEGSNIFGGVLGMAGGLFG